MSAADQARPLSWGDTFFLYLEREGQPLNIASTCEFEGKISKQACAKFVESKLHLIPRYKQRAVFPSFNLGLPTWEPDPHFDIRNHVHEVVLKQGTDSDLKEVAAKVISSRLDRNRPLWDITLVRGLKGDRTGMVFRIHHCMADGVSGVGVMNVLLDASPNPQKRLASNSHPRTARPTDSVVMLLDQFLKSYQSFTQGALTAQTEVLNVARELLTGAAQGHTEELMRLFPELVSVTERFPFNQICRGPQRIAWGELPMADIKAIRERCGGTVNDVVLTLIASTVRRYAEKHGVNVRGRQLRLVVPVNLRGDGDLSELGNKISFLPISVPLDVRDPRRLLAWISERIVFLRSVGVPEMVGMFGMLVSKVPLPVQAVLVPLLTQLPLSLANMICTNVPGPQLPLYLLGHRLLRCYPYVPIGGLLGVNAAILSYDGVAYVGFGGDVFAVPDIDCFEEMLRASFEEMRDAAERKPAPAKAIEKPARATARPRPIPLTKAVARTKAPKAKKDSVQAPASPKPRTAAAATIPLPAAVAAAAAVAAPKAPLAQAGD